MSRRPNVAIREFGNGRDRFMCHNGLDSFDPIWPIASLNLRQSISGELLRPRIASALAAFALELHDGDSTQKCMVQMANIAEVECDTHRFLVPGAVTNNPHKYGVGNQIWGAFGSKIRTSRLAVVALPPECLELGVMTPEILEQSRVEAHEQGIALAHLLKSELMRRL